MAYGSYDNLLSIVSLFISHWPASLLSLVGLSLLLAGLAFFWLSARSVNTMNGKKESRETSRNLKAKWALEQLRAIGPQMGIAIVFFSLGYLSGFNHKLNQALNVLTNKVEVLNAVVERQDGLILVYHYLDDPAEAQHSQLFCAEPRNRVPHFKPRQIIASMELVRREDCEVVADLKLRRVNGVAVLAGGY